MLKYLRIAVTALSLTASVLLIALWARSYARLDSIRGLLPSNYRFSLSGGYGRIRFATFDRTFEGMFTGARVSDWGASSNKIDRPPSMKLVNTPLTNFGLGFAGSSDRFGIVAVVPFWFPLVVASIVAAAPWLTRLQRFSLRTLLIATMLVAVALGIVAMSK